MVEKESPEISNPRRQHPINLLTEDRHSKIPSNVRLFSIEFKRSKAITRNSRTTFATFARCLAVLSVVLFLTCATGLYASSTYFSQPQIGLDQNSLIFNASAGGSSPPSQTWNIRTAGSGTLTWTATPSSAGNWLSITPGSGTGAAGITVSVAAGTLVAGTYTGSITFSATGALNSPATVPVIFRVAQTDAVGYVISTGCGTRCHR